MTRSIQRRTRGTSVHTALSLALCAGTVSSAGCMGGEESPKECADRFLLIPAFEGDPPEAARIRIADLAEVEVEADPTGDDAPWYEWAADQGMQLGLPLGADRPSEGEVVIVDLESGVTLYDATHTFEWTPVDEPDYCTNGTYFLAEVVVVVPAPEG